MSDLRHQIIGHGIDLVPVARIAKILDEHRERFLERTYTPQERIDCQGQRREAQKLASRFAAKEAVLKALGTGLTHGICMTEIGVVSLPSGKPTVNLTGNAARIAHAKGVSRFEISLTDTDDFAMASAIAIAELAGA